MCRKLTSSMTSLHRYLENRSQPMFSRLAKDEQGTLAIEKFFFGLTKARCSEDAWDGACGGVWVTCDGSAVAGQEEGRFGRLLALTKSLYVSVGDQADS